MRLIKEALNLIVEESGSWAWSSRDVLGRFGRLEGLSEAEKMRLAEADELSMVVGHLAEVAQLKVFPFTLQIVEGKLGSAVEILGDDGRPILILRAITDMLQARVAKYPEDLRAKNILSWYEYWIEPQTEALSGGEWLVFFSPPDRKSQFENKYGFVYLYRKDKDAVECTSVRLDWERENNYQVHDLGLFGKEYQSVEQILHFLGGEAADVGLVYADQLAAYQQILKMVLEGGDTEEYSRAVAQGNLGLMNRYLNRRRQEVLQKHQPEMWRLIEQEVDRYGYAIVNLGCGPMMFGGMGDGLNFTLMGIGDPGKSIYYCHACGHANPIDVDGGVYCEVCEACGAMAEKCV